MTEPENETKASPLPQVPVQGKGMSLKVPAFIAMAILFTLYLWRTFFGDFTPPLTSDHLKLAQTRWRDSQLTDYNLRLELKTTKLEVIEVQVRSGQPTSATLNGLPITQQRTMETWSVPGMMTTIAEDFQQHQSYTTGAATKQTPRLRLWCQFDANTGVPLKYRRLEWDKAHDIIWVVTKFERIEK